MNSIFWGEFLGTFVLVYLGNGVVANVLLDKTKGNGSGLMVIATAWGFAVTMGIFVATYFGSKSAHINPAITIAYCVNSGDFANTITMILAQLLGAFVGAVLAYIQYKQHYDTTENSEIILATFSTSPAIRSNVNNFISEFLGAFVLCFVGNTLGAVQNGLGPFIFGVLVWSIGLSLGGTTGYAINPARDLAPRIAHALLPIKNKGKSDWSYAWIPVLGPILGAIAGGFLASFA